jgi:hypothetical protein
MCVVLSWVVETKHNTNMTTKYRIYDTFNRRTVSNHRTLRTAVIAQDKFSDQVRKYNGPNSYIPTIIEYTDENGEWLKLPTDEVQDAQQQYLNN